MNMTQGNAFRKFWSLGYNRLLCVAPHDASLREAGKRPAEKGPSGWHGVSVKTFINPSEAELDKFHLWGGGVGIRCDGTFVAIDIDSLSPEWAGKIKAAALKVLGPAPVRIGRAPKSLLVYRAAGPIEYSQIRFDDGIDEKKPGLVECLSGADGTKWFVAHGIHPATGRPYTWPDGVPPVNELTTITAEQVASFFDLLRRELPHAKGSAGTSVDREAVDQTKLKGDPEVVRAAVEALPNNPEHFDYHGWVKLAAALRGACQDNFNLGLDLFCDFSEKAGIDDPREDPERIYKSVQPPFAIGAEYLYSLTDKICGTSFSVPHWFEVLPDKPTTELNLFEVAPKEKTDVYQLLSIDDVINRPPPVWLVDRHIPEKSVGFLYSEPGAGKTFMALDMSLSIAHGFDSWHGDPIKADPNTCVIYIASEGSFDLRTRLRAWRKARGFSENSSKRFHIIEQTINFMNADDIERLLRTVRSVAPMKAALIVVDTVSRALPGADENLQKDMTRFVQACDAVRDAFSCAVLGIHHAGKSGDMRGSTVLLGAGDFVFRLTRQKGASIGRFACEKQKAAPDGWDEPYRFDVISLNVKESSLVPTRADMSLGPSVALTPDVSAAVLSAMSKAWEEGSPWSRAPQAKERYAVKRMVSDFGFDAEKAEETLLLWEQTGLIATELRSAKHRMTGFKVAATPGQPVLNEGIFD